MPHPLRVNALEAAIFIREGDECARWCGMAGTTPEQVRAHYEARYPLPFRLLDALAEREDGVEQDA